MPRGRSRKLKQDLPSEERFGLEQIGTILAALSQVLTIVQQIQQSMQQQPTESRVITVGLQPDGSQPSAESVVQKHVNWVDNYVEEHKAHVKSRLGY